MQDGATRPADVESVVVAIADEWAKAIVSNNAVRIASFMADDWVMVSESGVSTKEQFLSFVNSGALTHSAMDRVSAISSFSASPSSSLSFLIASTACSRT